jgi:very-short-patch-repair endonuclease
MKALEQFHKPGSIVALRCLDIHAGLAAIKEDLDRGDSRVVTLHWTSAKQLDVLIDGAVEGLARLSLAVWPDWPTLPGASTGADGLAKQVSPNWREAALLYCQAGRLPLPLDYPAATQAAQLALTLGTLHLTIILAIEGEIERVDVTVLRAAGEWLAANTSASVFILVSMEETERSRLGRTMPLEDLFESSNEPLRFETADPEPSVNLFPIVGAPHPLSPGEQKLASHLRNDSELAQLFGFNQRVKGRHGHEYIVDLLWPDGRLVVEIDGFSVHRNRFAFAQDRHRDYELVAANYRVLRLTNDEAANDTLSAVEKIREIVKLIKRTSKQGESL